MPPNLGNTMFARWYNQQMSDYANRRQSLQDQRDDGRYQAEMLDAGAKRRAGQREQDRQDLEAKAHVAGAQAEALGNEMPQPEDPGMRVAVQQGAQGHTLTSLAAARAKREADAKMASEQAAKVNLESMGNASAEGIGRRNNATSIRVAEINASRPPPPPRGALTTGLKMSAQAEELRSALAELESIAHDPATGRADYARFQGAGPTAKKVYGWADAMTGGALPGDTTADYSRRKDFDSVRARIRAVDIHNFSGSAQTINEMRNLRDAILGDQWTDPIAFASTVRQLMRMADRQERLAMTVMAHGTFNEGSREFNAAVEALERGSGPPSNPHPVSPSSTQTFRVRMPDGSSARVRGNAQDFLRDHPGASVIE